MHTLVAAWFERTDIKKFIEEQKLNIVTIKSILDIDVPKERDSSRAVATTKRAGEKLPCSAVMYGELFDFHVHRLSISVKGLMISTNWSV